jgi:hypothetical protein
MKPAPQLSAHGSDTAAMMIHEVPSGFIESRSLLQHGELPFMEPLRSRGRCISRTSGDHAGRSAATDYHPGARLRNGVGSQVSNGQTAFLHRLRTPRQSDCRQPAAGAGLRGAGGLLRRLFLHQQPPGLFSFCLCSLDFAFRPDLAQSANRTVFSLGLGLAAGQFRLFQRWPCGSGGYTDRRTESGGAWFTCCWPATELPISASGIRSDGCWSTTFFGIDRAGLDVVSRGVAGRLYLAFENASLSTSPSMLARRF